MKKNNKAIILSLLIFPGSGHLFLKRYIFGALLMGIASVATYFVVSGVISTALDLANKISSGEVSPDIFTLTALLTQQSVAGQFQFINFATHILLAVWLVGIIDTFRIIKQ